MQRLVLLCALLRPPIIELKDDTQRYFKRNFSGARYRVPSRLNLNNFADWMRPGHTIDFERSTLAAIVIKHPEVGLAIG